MWGTLDNLYTPDPYSAIVDRIASKLVLCFGTLFSTGVGTRGAGGAEAPLKFVKGGLSPLN